MIAVQTYRELGLRIKDTKTAKPSWQPQGILFIMVQKLSIMLRWYIDTSFGLNDTRNDYALIDQNQKSHFQGAER